MTIADAIAELLVFRDALDPNCDENDAIVRMAIDTLLDNRRELIEQLQEQSKSFCTHCGQLFPKGRQGVAEFREHIVECNAHPLHPLAKVLEAARIALDSCRVGMKTLTSEGVHSSHFNSDAEQFAAAWRDLRKAVDNARG